MWIYNLEGDLINLAQLQRIHIEPLDSRVEQGLYAVLAESCNGDRHFLFTHANENICKNFINKIGVMVNVRDVRP